jgi:hypothetical protein
MVDLVHDLRIDISRPEKIRVQGMNHPLIRDGGASCGQRLAQNLAAENLWRANVPTLSAKDIVINPFQVKQVDQVSKNRVHSMGHSFESG